jgi:hypothetical protein
MFNWLFGGKQILTESQKKNLQNESNGWFTEQEIMGAFNFKIPEGQIKINEKVIYFNLEILTGLDFRFLPGDPQSLYWYFCEKWFDQKRQDNIKLYLESEWGFIFPFKRGKVEVQYAAILYALSNSQVEDTVIMINDKKQREIILEGYFCSAETENVIDFDKFDLDKKNSFLV